MVVPKKNRSSLKRLTEYYRPHIGLFAADMAAAFLLALCDLFFPMVIRNIINVYVPNKDTKAFFFWTLFLLVVYGVKVMLNYFVLSWGHIMGTRMQADMRKDLFRHMQRLPFSYFDENQTGSLISRIVNDLMDISELAHHGPEDLFLSIVMLVGAFFYLAQINLVLTCIVFALLPAVIVFNLFMRRYMKKSFMARRETIAGINSEIENSISGIRVAKAFTNAEYELEKFSDRTDQYVQASTTAYKTMGIYHSGMNLFLDLLSLVTLFIAGVFVFQGKINIGDFTAYLLYISLFTQPIRRLGAFAEQFQDGMSGFTRFLEVMDLPLEANPDTPVLPDKVEGNIQFQNVSFNYGESGNVLDNITLSVPAGKTYAIVGPSGGGKTTMCHLIPRFYTPQSGSVMLDGVDVQNIDYTHLRKLIGIVQQDVFIFAGSVRDNIAYGNLEATPQEIESAAKKAGLHDFIQTLPQGYDTYIGERGAKLSGGQKQRISIARVFLKNPPVLILDEATSSLDNITEQSIQEAFYSLAKNRTTLVVAHRLSTVKNADCIVVLTDNGIEEQGSHSQLMQKEGGLYKILYDSQFPGLA